MRREPFSQAFVPVLTEYRETPGHEEVRELAASVSGVLGAILLLVSALGVVAAPVLVLVFAPGFVGAEAKYELSVQLLRITFPYIFFISLTALAAGILNTYGRFGVPAFTPALAQSVPPSAAARGARAAAGEADIRSRRRSPRRGGGCSSPFCFHSSPRFAFWWRPG